MVNDLSPHNTCRTTKTTIFEPIFFFLTPKVINTNLEHSDTTKQYATNGSKLDNLQIYHQNIRGLHNKIDELTTQWTVHPPHLLCFMEHHLKESEITNIHIKNYTLGASYCRHSRTHGGVCIFFAKILIIYHYQPK